VVLFLLPPAPRRAAKRFADIATGRGGVFWPQNVLRRGVHADAVHTLTRCGRTAGGGAVCTLTRCTRGRMGRLVRRVLSQLGCSKGQPRSGRPSISALRCRSTPAVYPRTRRAASAFSVWPCSGRGLHSRSVTRTAGGLLHHRFTLTPHSPRRPCAWRSAFCCTFSRVAPGGCYPPPCSVEPGRSSAHTPKQHQDARRDRLVDPFAFGSL